MSGELRMGQATPDDRCARCGHRRELHREDGCHYLGPHGGEEKRCGGRFSGYVAEARCSSFVESGGEHA